MEATERSRRYAEILEYLKGEQRAGRLDPDMDVEMTLLLIIAAASFPMVFGQVVRLVTGTGP